MYKSERIDLRLAPRDVQILDEKRGNISRSAFIRWLIQHHDSFEPVNPVDVVTWEQERKTHPHPDPVVPPIDEPPIPSPIEPPVPPPSPVETGAKRHFHRYKKAGEPVEYRQAVPYYRQKCSCGDTRVAP